MSCNSCEEPSFIFRDKSYYCSLAIVMELIGGKWKPMVLFHLKDGALRSGDLQRQIKGISNKMFTQAVRELEKDGLLDRIVYPEVPPKVEYKLSKLGEDLLPIVINMAEWGKKFAKPQTY